MKILAKSFAYTDYVVDVPSEILSHIVLWVQAFADEIQRRRTLWSCCMLSRSWYQASIPWLYRSPRLSNRNFDQFARTICPPVNSHVRRVGLEAFIRHLDMGHLAYESSKSLTARLLRRTCTSLESFIAPTVSFSIACLAPLSKCRNLQSLDLSHDFYNFDLTQLLNAVAPLPHLVVLSLPKSAMRRRCPLKVAASGQSSWPQKLSYLQINDCLPQDSQHWNELIASWPPTLTKIAFENCFNWNSFFYLPQAGSRAVFIKSLIVSMRSEEYASPVEILLVAFPNLVYLAIPTPVGVAGILITASGMVGKGEDLTRLVFRPVPDGVQPKPKVTVGFLWKCIEAHPKLTNIELPEAYLDVDDAALQDLDKIEEVMAIRAGLHSEDSGVFLTEV